VARLAVTTPDAKAPPRSPLDVDELRSRFPALSLTHDGRPVVFLDGPGGTQVPRAVIDAVVAYYRESNANSGGAFPTSRRSDSLISEAREAFADFLGAASSEEIKFGPNMTTLTFAVSRAIGATLGEGDEIVVTALDHDANVAPWRALAERGAVIRTVGFDPADCTLDQAAMLEAIGPRTRVVAVGLASNAVGTINDLRPIVARAREVGALVYVDAVHYAPHGPIDVTTIGCDLLACSAYKFFGPHLGVLWGRATVLDALPAYKVRPAHDRWETGTQDHEGIVGAGAALGYLADVGARYGAPFAAAFPGLEGRRLALRTAMAAIRAYESGLLRRLMEGLVTVPGLRVFGITDPARFDRRVPTVAFTLEGWRPRHLAEALAADGIFVWDGDMYALELIERLGLADSGGVVRVGLVHYNTAGEVDRLLDTLGRIAWKGGAITESRASRWRGPGRGRSGRSHRPSR
jgi:cysteine desulfurase family protein (TIGR01976 family)